LVIILALKRYLVVLYARVLFNEESIPLPRWVPVLVLLEFGVFCYKVYHI